MTALQTTPSELSTTTFSPETTTVLDVTTTEPCPSADILGNATVALTPNPVSPTPPTGPILPYEMPPDTVDKIDLVVYDENDDPLPYDIVEVILNMQNVAEVRFVVGAFQGDWIPAVIGVEKNYLASKLSGATSLGIEMRPLDMTKNVIVSQLIVNVCI